MFLITENLSPKLSKTFNTVLRGSPEPGLINSGASVLLNTIKCLRFSIRVRHTGAMSSTVNRVSFGDDRALRKEPLVHGR